MRPNNDLAAFAFDSRAGGRAPPWRPRRPQQNGPAYPFFAFQDGMGGVPLQEQPKLLKELGYDGMEFEGPPKQIPEMLKALDAQGLKMFSIIRGAKRRPGQAAVRPRLKDGHRATQGPRHADFALSSSVESLRRPIRTIGPWPSFAR